MPPRMSPLRVFAWSLLVLLLFPGNARSDPTPPPDVADAPLPGQESGQVVPASNNEPSTARVIARGALWVPRAAAEAVLLPVRGGVYLYDRYDLGALYYEVFYNEDRTIGVIPTLVYSTGFGLLAGARFISTDTFGGDEQLIVQAAYGGTYQVNVEAWLDTGVRLDPVLITAGGNFDRYAHLPFYGIGNANESPPPQMLIDPLVNPTAVKTHYRYQELRASVVADWRMLDQLHLLARGDITEIDYGESTTEPPLGAVYNPMDVVGFLPGVKHLYGELTLRWDRRRIARPPWETTAYTTGWFANAYVGGVHGFDGAQGFAHYGFDLQGFLHFALGPRMLVLRLRGEGVTGSIDEVPFTELPYLGGDLLRGYDFARFRDRVSALGTAQYVWDISRFINAFMFVDAGRVYHALDDLTFDDMRIGFGGGLEFHTNSEFVVSGTLASSKDGGVFVTASLNPLWNEVPRWR